MKVTAGNAPIELETERISDVRTAEQLRTLPLNDPGLYSTLGDHTDDVVSGRDLYVCRQQDATRRSSRSMAHR